MKFKVHFHDYVYGRIDFTIVVESDSMESASKVARQKIQMPPYIIANYVERIYD